MNDSYGVWFQLIWSRLLHHKAHCDDILSASVVICLVLWLWKGPDHVVGTWKQLRAWPPFPPWLAGWSCIVVRTGRWGSHHRRWLACCWPLCCSDKVFWKKVSRSCIAIRKFLICKVFSFNVQFSLRKFKTISGMTYFNGKVTFCYLKILGIWKYFNFYLSGQ